VSLYGEPAFFSLEFDLMCISKVPNEPTLQFSVILAMDGNDSQRRLARNHSDQEEFLSMMFLSKEFVDKFKDEVKRKPVSINNVI
jgi:hypothetical protein